LVDQLDPHAPDAPPGHVVGDPAADRPEGCRRGSLALVDEAVEPGVADQRGHRAGRDAGGVEHQAALKCLANRYDCPQGRTAVTLTMGALTSNHGSTSRGHRTTGPGGSMRALSAEVTRLLQNSQGCYPVSFAHPERLWLMLVVPVLAAWVVRARRRRVQDWAALGQGGRPGGDGGWG